MDELNWKYNNTIFTEEMIGDNYGFVYEITGPNGRKYIGKKFFYSQKTKQVKGKKKKILVESDWKEYYGSSKELQEDVLSIGQDKFKREILRFCETKGECSYYEAKFQFQFDVLLNPKEWYNSWISCRVRRTHLKGVFRDEEEI